MLDKTAEIDPGDTIAAEDAADEDTLTGEGEETVAAEEGGEVVITIEGEEAEIAPEDVIPEGLGEAGERALKAAREAAKLARAEARDLKARLAEKEVAAPAQDELGPRPVIADYGFNDEKHAEALLAWGEKKRELDARKADETARQKAANDAYQDKLTRYHAERAKVGVDDDVQSVVVAALNPQQQSALMDASLDPAKVVAALAKTPKVLAELAGIKEIHKFTYRLAQVEGKIQMTTKPPPPESRLRGGVAVPAGSLSAQLEAAEKKAEQTGDRTEVQRIKRQMRDAGVAR